MNKDTEATFSISTYYSCITSIVTKINWNKHQKRENQLLRNNMAPTYIILLHSRKVYSLLFNDLRLKSISQACRSEQLGWHAGRQEVNRCHTRGESEDSVPRRWQSHKWRKTQGRRYQKLKTRVSVALQKDFGVLQQKFWKDWNPVAIVRLRRVLILFRITFHLKP